MTGFAARCEDCDEGSRFGAWKDAHEWVRTHNKEHHKEKQCDS